MTAELTFEEGLKGLETIVKRLEEEELPLEEALKVFEDGIRLSRRCAKYLDEAGKRIETLTRGETGGPVIGELEADV